MKVCDPGEARTHDPVIKSHLLYQLSYRVILINTLALVNELFHNFRVQRYYTNSIPANRRINFPIFRSKFRPSTSPLLERLPEG